MNDSWAASSGIFMAPDDREGHRIRGSPVPGDELPEGPFVAISCLPNQIRVVHPARFTHGDTAGLHHVEVGPLAGRGGSGPHIQHLPVARVADATGAEALPAAPVWRFSSNLARWGAVTSCTLCIIVRISPRFPPRAPAAPPPLPPPPRSASSLLAVRLQGPSTSTL